MTKYFIAWMNIAKIINRTSMSCITLEKDADDECH